jgi:hypothetical protein
MRCSTWNVRSLPKTGALKTVVSYLGKYKLGLESVQEVRWEKSGTERAVVYTFFVEKGTGIIS